jgi:ribosomal protein S12 methylthiotransferase
MKGETVCLISLGCPKNLVDSEVILGLLAQNGYGITTAPAEADIIVINTCSFIQAATEEGLETIFEAVHLKGTGSCRRLIVTGCLPQRYGQELVGQMPEVDFFLGTGEFPHIVEYLESPSENRPQVAIGRRDSFLYDHETPRLLSGPRYSAYIKIAEGCSRSCSFCIVPSLRGRLRSRPISSVYQEARHLVDQGVREINLIGQDTTSYGRDLQDGTTLAALLARLNDLCGLEWIRILYAYPEHIDSDLLRQIRLSDSVCKYIDLPIQHVNEEILRSMGRPASPGSLKALIRKIRDEIPGVCLRTTLLVGFPGETEAQYSELLEFVEMVRFERLGVFQFSPEDGTRAAAMRSQVPASVRRRRFERIMELQQRISLENNTALIGETVPVLIEERLGENGMLKGRMATQAPEIDGHVTLSCETASPGQFADVLIRRVDPYDLEGERV